MARWMTRSVLSVVVLVGIAGLAQAQEFRNMELNTFVALSSHTKNQFEIGFPQTITPIQAEFKLNNTTRGGLRFNVNTTRHWGEEVFFSYEPNKARLTRKTTPAQTQNLPIRTYNFGINAMYYMNEEEKEIGRAHV